MSISCVIAPGLCTSLNIELGHFWYGVVGFGIGFSFKKLMLKLRCNGVEINGVLSSWISRRTAPTPSPLYIADLA